MTDSVSDLTARILEAAGSSDDATGIDWARVARANEAAADPLLREAALRSQDGDGRLGDGLLDWARSVVALPPLERAQAVSAKLAVLTGLEGDPRGIVDAALAEAEAAAPHAMPRLPDELTESDSAHLFARQHRGRVWYTGEWLVYEEMTGRFVRDADAALRLVQQTVAGMRTAARGKDDRPLARFVTHAASAAGLTNILRLAQIEPELRTSLDTFDSAPHLVNLRNGVYDLRSGKLLPHDPSYRMTHLAGVMYEPEAACPRWIGHLDTIFAGDLQLLLFFQRWAGRALSGISPSDNRRILMPYGSGANGKTVTVETLAAVLGDYAATTDFATWCASQDSGGASQRQDLVELAGKRLVAATESGYHHRLDEALLKQYTGGERVSPRGMYARRPTVFRPCFSLLLSTNHLPKLEGADQGFWRRFLKIGFNVSIPEPDQDPQLLSKLADELPGIFNWLADGYSRWSEQGLDPPTSVLMETAEYRSDIDVIGQFMEQELDRAEGVDTPLERVFARYTIWCSAAGIKRPLTANNLAIRLREHGVEFGKHPHTRRSVMRDHVLRPRDHDDDHRTWEPFE